jgi:hypothetical protein
MRPNFKCFLALTKLKFWGRNNIFRMIIMGMLSAFALSLNLTGGIIYTVLVLIIYTLLWISLPAFARKNLKKNKDFQNLIIDYTFNGDKSVNIITTRGEDKLSEFNLQSRDIIKIKETKVLILIYITKRQAFYIDKSILTAEQITEIKSIVSKDKKYKTAKS